MKNNWAVALVLISFLSPAFYAFANSLDQWKYHKEVRFENKEDVKAIFLDKEIYRHAREDLGDLRLINEKGEFIPYYIYNRFLSGTKEEYTEYIAKGILSFAKDKDYFNDFELSPVKNNVDIIGNKLRFDISSRNFFKEIRIYGSYDNKSWEAVKSDIIYRVNGVEKIEVVLGNNYKYSYYRVQSVNDVSGIAINKLILIYDYNEDIYDEYRGATDIGYNVSLNKDRKETEVNIHNIDRLKISNIRIMTKDNFNRSYVLYASNEQGERLQRIGQGEIYQLDLNQFKAEKKNIPLDYLKGNFQAHEYLQIVINDRDDYPIKIDNIEITYYIDKVVFRTNQGGKVYIIFGNKDAERPHYDISKNIDQIERVVQETTTLSGLVKRVEDEKAPEKRFEIVWLLNASVVVICGLLIILITQKGVLQSK